MSKQDHHDHLTEDELGNLSRQSALALLKGLHLQPRNPETAVAIKRMTLLLLREDESDDADAPYEPRLLH